MKTAIVPAQITTVEDRIAGNLTFPQLGLLAAPIITAMVSYVAVTPRFQLGIPKLAFILLQFALLGPMAIRINGKIVASWLIAYARFIARPRIYVHLKTDVLGRGVEAMQEEVPEVQVQQLESEIQTDRRVQPLHELIKVDRLLQDPSVTVSFEISKKGGLDVTLAPVEQ